MRKNLIAVCILLNVVLTLNAKEIPAELEGVELYDWLTHDGIFDPKIDDKTIQSVLEHGLFNDDKDISNAAIGTIIRYLAIVSARRRQPSEDEPLIARDLHGIEGLRALLVDTWNHEHKQNPNFISEMNNSDWLDMFETRNERVVARLDKVWLGIPNSLAILYPKDSEVHDILWKTYDPKQVFQMLIRLEDGEFETKKATDFRIEMLLDENTPHFAIAAAARGLGLFRSDEGLEALLTRLKNTEKTTDAIAHIIEAIVAHGEKAVPFADLLRSTADQYTLISNDTLTRPTGYNSNHVIGLKYRVQVALQKLEELEESHDNEE